MIVRTVNHKELMIKLSAHPILINQTNTLVLYNGKILHGPAARDTIQIKGLTHEYPE